MKAIVVLLRLLWRAHKQYRNLPKEQKLRIQREAFEKRAEELRREEDMVWIKKKHQS